ncbi:MAG: hypothetical protein IJR26_08115 [Bacteroidales bacterium]|nr:hypothetical protein [Bacteroidales bacterium]
MNKRFAFTVLALSCFQIATLGYVRAQADTTRSTYNESVIVVGDYNPVLDGVTEKVNVAPAVNDAVAADLAPKFTYSIEPRRMSSLTTATGLKAAKVVASPTRIYDNYMRFGLGHDFARFGDFNPLIDLYYTSKRHDDYAFGGRLFHESDWSTFGKEEADTPSPDFYGSTREAQTRFDIFGKYILNQKHLFSADLAFDRHYGRYYGFNDSLFFARTGQRRADADHDLYAFAYNDMALNLGAKSLNTDVNQFGYEADYELADLWGKLDFSQLRMRLDGNVHYGFPLFSKYKGVTYLHLTWDGYRQHRGAEALPYDTLGFTDIRHLLTINPYVDFLFKDFKIHGGFAVGIKSLRAMELTRASFFPDVIVTKTLSNNRVSLTAGFVGGYMANDWNSMRLFNPYVAPAPVSTVGTDNNLYAHIRINFSKRLMLNLNADNHFYRNKMFFMLDMNSFNYGTLQVPNQFAPYYMNLKNLVLSGDFTFTNDEMIRMSIGGECYLYYNKSTETPLYHTPAFVGHFDVDLNYKDQWLVRAQALLITKQDAYYSMSSVNTFQSVTGQIGTHFGLSLEAEYIHSRALSFFAKLDNVTLQRYFLWAYYPAERFNLMLGLTYTLPRK